MKKRVLHLKRVMQNILITILLSVVGQLNAQDFTVGNLNYSVHSGTDVIVTGHVDGTAATGPLVIPETVTTSNGIVCTVVWIGRDAFQNCSGLTGTLTIPHSVSLIGGNAFKNCSGFTSINVWAEAPPTIGIDAFVGVDHDIPITVFCGSLGAYQNSWYWSQFNNIQEPDQCFLVTATANLAAGGTVTGGNQYPQGYTCTLTATPNPGYIFTNWTENGEEVSTNPSYSFVVEGGRNLVANFVYTAFRPYVDLGLPSGTLWATYNLGAESPEGYGDSFTWGQTQPDVVTANWGGDWRMPTGVELQELCDNTTFSWTIWNGVNGALFTASNGNSVFFPAAGIRYESAIYNRGSAGYYWSNETLWLLIVVQNGSSMYHFEEYDYYDHGLSVRPVRTSTQIPPHVINVTANHADFGEVSGGGSYPECSECTVTATTSNEDCMFAYWKENDEIVSMDTTYTFMVTEDRNLVACFFHPDFHEYVDLGLPSGTMWATCNVGSCYPEQDYSTTPYYSWGCDYCEDSGLTKYCNNPDYGVNGYSDTLTTLLPEDDVATCEWGIGWRTPTAEEWEELTQNTTFTWKLVYNNGEVVGSGALFTAPNGNSVFLPAINRKYNPTMTFFDNEQGPFYYWTSSLDTINPLNAYHISGGPATYEMGSSSRCEGLCVRPVLSTVPSDFYTVSVTVHPEEGGTVTGTGEYSFGELCSLTAIPNEDFVFTNWKKAGVVVSTDATYSFRVYGNCSYEACFVHSNPTYVDLGLPSGLLWADCNVGANAPEECGDYFAWGETQPKRKYDWDTYRYCTKDYITPSDFIYILTKYNATDSLTILEPGDDAATMLYDNISHTPTKEEWQELLDNCTSSWTTLNGVEGRQFIGPSGDSIFLPAAGFRAESTLSQSSVVGAYHSSSIVSEDPSAYYSYYDGWVFYFHPYAYYMNDYCQRSVGRSVRAVRPAGLTYVINATANPTGSGTISGTGSYLENSTCTLTASANEGYSFINWTKDGTEVSTSAIYSFTVTENADFVANFAPSTCTITTTANPTDGGTVTGAGTYDYGTTAILSATPNEGYRFSRWTKNGTTVSTNANYSFTVTEDAAFVANFTAYNPDEDIIQTTNFAQGWNWWSSYVEMDAGSLQSLQDGLGTSGTMIKSQNDGYASYLEGFGWYGSLAAINNQSTYQVKTSAACTVEMTGNAANSEDHPITLNSGWTWVGYPVNASMAIADALSGIEPQNGDMLKSQNNGYASYLDGFGWYGSLSTLQPGMGLMFKSNNSSAVTLVYPNNGTRTDLRDNQTTENNHWQPNLNAYPDNMSVMAVVELDGEELASERYELAAFANGECRGSARLMYVEPLDRYMAFLTVAGDEATGLHFGLYNVETGDVETQNFASLQYE
ncbi:MAG: leucine-rich repeat protein, partial [Bacteroidales bacterium]|nr:leucine-rich repeat protein [Bacteroidales bacterium]